MVRGVSSPSIHVHRIINTRTNAAQEERGLTDGGRVNEAIGVLRTHACSDDIAAVESSCIDRID